MSEKPIECSKCQRDASIEYKEIKDGKIACYKMCKNCPYLKEKMMEHTNSTPCIFQNKDKTCKICSQTLEEFQISLTLGCEKCLETFQESLEKELISQDIMTQTIKDNHHLEKYHFGNTPNDFVDPGFSKTLENLHLALNLAVSKEKFEEAADIQSQIKQYMEKTDEQV